MISWIGEDVWIDNLAHVYIGNNVVYLKEQCYLWKSPLQKSTFDLIIGEITIKDGVWIAADQL